ncbi:MAG: hypothetical protein JNJ54_15320 [Myxococcaceae bacterium]|nr:hypothetical protein [Myxococcaceae bacterium]
MTSLVLSLVLAADPSAARLLDSHVAAGVGVLGSAYTVTGARLGEAALMPTLSARGVLAGFVVEGGAFVSSSLVRGGTVFSLTGAARVGYSGQRWAVVAGVITQVAPEAQPSVQVLPSVRASVSFGAAGLTLGVFDHLGLVPAHLSVDLRVPNGRFSLGWVAPLGLLASADVDLVQGFGLRVTAFGFRLGNVESALLLVSGTWGGAR